MGVWIIDRAGSIQRSLFVHFGTFLSGHEAIFSIAICLSLSALIFEVPVMASSS